MSANVPDLRSSDLDLRSTSTISSVSPGDGFDSFWSLYPKKKEKPTAQVAFKVARKKADLETILSALQTDVRSEDWERDGGKFIPYPAKWLKRERWLDEDQTQRLVSPLASRNRLLTPEERGE